MDKVGYTSVTTCAGHAKLFHPRNIHLGQTTIGQEWQPLIFTVYFSAAGPKSKTIYRYESRPCSDCLKRNSPVSIGYLQPRPKQPFLLLGPA